jgi:hypothetical protein
LTAAFLACDPSQVTGARARFDRITSQRTVDGPVRIYHGALSDSRSALYAATASGLEAITHLLEFSQWITAVPEHPVKSISWKDE